MTEWKDLGEVSRGRRHAAGKQGAGYCRYYRRGDPPWPPSPRRGIAWDAERRLDLSCCPRETSPRSLPSDILLPQVARCREVALRAALPSPRRPGVIHGVTPPGSGPTHYIPHGAGVRAYPLHTAWRRGHCLPTSYPMAPGSVHNHYMPHDAGGSAQLEVLEFRI